MVSLLDEFIDSISTNNMDNTNTNMIITSLQLFKTYITNLSVSTSSNVSSGLKIQNTNLEKKIDSFIRTNVTKKNKTNALTNLFLWKQNNELIPSENIQQNIKSLLYKIGIIYPQYISNTNDDTTNRIHKHWNLLPMDIDKLSNKLQIFKQTIENNDQTTLSQYKKHHILLPIMQNYITNFNFFYKFVILLLPECSVYTVSFTNELYSYLINISILLYIHTSTNTTVFNNIRQDIYNIDTKNTTISDDEIDAYIVTEMNDILDVDVVDLNIQIDVVTNQINNILADYLVDTINTLKTKKNVSSKESNMMSYADIMQEVDFSKDREKQQIKNHFKNMSQEQRASEVVLKKLKLGQFHVDIKNINKYGKTKGLFGEVDEDAVLAGNLPAYQDTTNYDTNNDINNDINNDNYNKEDDNDNEESNDPLNDDINYSANNTFQTSPDEDDDINDEEDNDYHDMNEHIYNDGNSNND